MVIAEVPQLGMLATARELVRQEGFRGLYRGLAPACMRAFPANAACFFGMESSKRFLDTIM